MCSPILAIPRSQLSMHGCFQHMAISMPWCCLFPLHLFCPLSLLFFSYIDCSLSIDLLHQCPDCLVFIKHRWNLIDHFNSSPICRYHDPNLCLISSTVSGRDPPHPLTLQEERLNLHYEASLPWDPASLNDDDDKESIVGTEGNPSYPPLASNHSLQEDSDVGIR